MKADILDSSAWLECLDDGPNTKHFAPIIAKHPEILVPAIVITEVRKVALRQRTSDQAESITRSLLAAEVIEIDSEIAVAAADLAIKHKLPLADSLIYAITLAKKATLWTQDDDFKDLPRVRYFPKKKP
ncbi:MAG: putative nucleic acid-binding protein [Akkermansiaceae bacterium]|jgi:predicted nucleic acid-binding protein